MRGAAYVYRYAPLKALDGAEASLAVRSWLTGAEQTSYAVLRDPQRRRNWLAGRVLAKRLIVEQWARRHGGRLLRPRQVQIVAAVSGSGRQRPAAWADGRPLDWSLSIAHSDEAVLVALGCAAGASVGVDLVRPMACGRGFTELWFTAAERRWLRAADAEAAATAWAVKEAVYKAANRGEPFEPRQLEVFPAPGGGYLCRLAGSGPGRVYRVCAWRTPRAETAILALGGPGH